MAGLPTLNEAKQTAILLASNQPLTNSQHVQINKLLITIFESSNLSRILLTEAVLNCLRHQQAPKCVATIDEYSAQFSWEKSSKNTNLKPLAGPKAKIKRIDERIPVPENQCESDLGQMRFTSDESDESESMPPPSPKSGSSRSLKRTHGRKRTSRNSSDSIDLTEQENRTCSPNLARELNRLAPRSRYSKSPSTMMH